MRTEAAIGGVLIAVMTSAAATAGDRLVPYASVQAEYNSNVFDLPDPQHDFILRYLGGIEANLPWRSQKLRAVAEGRRMNFSDLKDLDHNEYLLAGGLDWSVSSSFDGTLDYRQERRMASFADRSSTQLSLEDERLGAATAKLALNPEWRLQSGLHWRALDSPLPDFPEFALKEKSATAAIEYLGVEELAAGIYGEYLQGRFDGIPDAGKFHQWSLALTADYSISDVSRVSAQLGYTRRQDQTGGNGALSGITGQLAYHREITGKTTLDLQAFRRVRSYVGGASSVEETGAASALTWQPTDKMALAGIYQWTHSSFHEEAAATGGDRRDNAHVASLKLTWQALDWLALRPYVAYQLRDSNVALERYHATMAGLELQVRFR